MKYGFTLMKIIREGTSSRINSHFNRYMKITFSWEFTAIDYFHDGESLAAILMKIMLSPNLHQYFHDGFLWYFVRGHLHELISWEFGISWESPMDFVRVWYFMRVAMARVQEGQPRTPFDKKSTARRPWAEQAITVGLLSCIVMGWITLFFSKSFLNSKLNKR